MELMVASAESVETGGHQVGQERVGQTQSERRNSAPKWCGFRQFRLRRLTNCVRSTAKQPVRVMHRNRGILLLVSELAGELRRAMWEGQGDMD
jgi:hypothetical protein